jgi:predicted cation transporter
MSRFKTYAIFQAMLAAIVGNKKLTPAEKETEARRVNRLSGGYMFSGGSVIPGRLPNQRQRRKKLRQVPQLRKK